MDGARLARLLAYCRLDEHDLSREELQLLESFHEASISYMEDAGVAVPAEDQRRRLAKFNLVVDAMTLQAWDHRDLTEIAAAAESPGLRRIINQLKWSEPDHSDVSDSDTGTEECDFS